MSTYLNGGENISGKVRAYNVTDDNWTAVTEYKNNLVLYQWAEIASKLLTTGDSRFRIGGLYLEFENTANPGDTVSLPAFNRSRNIEYYNELAGSATRDYLRVPLTASPVASAGTGLSHNQITFFARSGGVSGVHGKPFSYAANSVIIGASLVAFIDVTDATRDLLFSSFYFATEDQQQKLATSQVGIEWVLTLQ
jgi:hypothetical protein